MGEVVVFLAAYRRTSGSEPVFNTTADSRRTGGAGRSAFELDAEIHKCSFDPPTCDFDVELERTAALRRLARRQPPPLCPLCPPWLMCHALRVDGLGFGRHFVSSCPSCPSCL